MKQNQIYVNSMSPLKMNHGREIISLTRKNLTTLVLKIF